MYNYSLICKNRYHKLHYSISQLCNFQRRLKKNYLTLYQTYCIQYIKCLLFYFLLTLFTVAVVAAVASSSFTISLTCCVKPKMTGEITYSFILYLICMNVNKYISLCYIVDLQQFFFLLLQLSAVLLYCFRNHFFCLAIFYAKKEFVIMFCFLSN